MAEPSNLGEALQRLTAITGASILMTQFMLKQLVGEIATFNRNPTQAKEFVVSLRTKMSSFASELMSDDTEADQVFKKEMDDFIALVMDGIEFEKRK